METKWFKNAVIYGVDIAAFQDADGDGVGDIRGLIERLDYVADLGVNCLWLLPFYPSPWRDNGYDVANYYGVDPRYGTLDDFRDLIQETNQRGIKVMIDLVAHHTSDQHPWFQAARSDPESLYRDYYIWSKKIPKTPTERSFFPEVESGVWRYDPISKSYFRHGFYHFQPDLNFANARVQDEVFAIVDFWMSLGVHAFRIDAANHIMGRKSLPETEVASPSAFWQKLRNYMVSRKPDSVLLAEADMDMSELHDYVLDGNGVHMFLNFWVNQAIMHALATGHSRSLTDMLSRLPPMPTGAQYVNFLRNLDELNLERLGDAEQKAVFQEFGYNKHMQIYGRGIRRRLAPMLRGDQDRLKMAFTLLFSMPGTPLVIYGDEIGLGDNLALEERDSVRAPMQWTSDRNGGFSSADTSAILKRAITSPHYHHADLNVQDQTADRQSLLNFIKRLVKLRLVRPIIGNTHARTIPTGQSQVVALAYEDGPRRLFTFHNLSNRPCKIKLDSPEQLPLAQQLPDLKEIWRNRRYKKPDAELDLSSYGWRWFANE